jgi:hypothetical protein
VEINPELELPKDQTLNDYLILSKEESILGSYWKVLIINNIRYPKSDKEKAKNALSLMKKLMELKSKYSLSILILAHTPKRDLSKPIITNDLQWSKMLINFCDSSFTIAEPNQDKEIRYIKQRNCKQIFDADTVCECQIIKEHNFLQLAFVNYGMEASKILFCLLFWFLFRVLILYAISFICFSKSDLIHCLFRYVFSIF